MLKDLYRRQEELWSTSVEMEFILGGSRKQKDLSLVPFPVLM